VLWSKATRPAVDNARGGLLPRREQRKNPWARSQLLTPSPEPADSPPATAWRELVDPATDVGPAPPIHEPLSHSVPAAEAGESWGHSAADPGSDSGPAPWHPAKKSDDGKEWAPVNSGQVITVPARDGLRGGTEAPVRIAWYVTDRQRVEPVPRHRRLPVWSGPVTPHLGGSDADDLGSAEWWWLGVHGGSGVSTLAALLPGGAHAHRCWPDPAHGGPRVVVLVCRTHLAGLGQARDAARQWASADVPAGLLLGGAVAVADSPGRPARPQAEALRLLAGAVPRLWTVPWIEDLRACAEPGTLPLPPALVRLRADLETLRAGRRRHE
jgi:hypothetical protein